MKKEVIGIGIVVLIILVLVILYFSLTRMTSCGDCGLPKGNLTYSECVKDSDCAKAGCSGQLCVKASEAKTIVTTCEWKDEYACYQSGKCGCVEGKCDWNEEVNTCLKNF